MTPSEADEQGNTAPIDTSGHPPPPGPPVSSPPPEPPPPSEPVGRVENAHPSVASSANPPVSASAEIAAATSLTPEQGQVTFVPLAVTIGDGFKFGCGFFLAMVVALLVGFVLLAALFVLTSLFGLTFPLAR